MNQDTQRKSVKKKSEPKKWLASFAHKLSKTKWITLPGALIIVVIALIIAGTASTVDNLATTIEEFIEEQTATPRHPLTGAALDEPLEILPQVIGIMVENSADAWPLAGLNEAFLVIEAPVEGNIPRFISFFSEEDDVDKVGPVRSARPYYLDWNDELDAVYMHVGGSPEALDLIKYDYDTIDLNQFFQSEYFYRQTNGRYAPHNVFTSADHFIASLSELLLDPPAYEPWLFKDDASERGEAKSAFVDMGSGYGVTWLYDKEVNTYYRFQGTDTRLNGSDIVRMEDGEFVQANNVIVIETDIEVIDAIGRKKIRTRGEGGARVMQDGIVIEATWKKETRTDRIRFYDLEGQELAVNAGSTWIQVVSSLENQLETSE
jgi:hypothetical protein